ncbi:hypothetical protein K469DRAFT_727325 [Zopfia rhizophila CBS 207.26]|uniref:Ima1 N-terminal domain-containing protein n=1 Tax=Zopfia rhizophila CBS 207.26 TaxID=1314779 RepID=A0A6A6E1Q3_9PEZI|nr:hypothetical protein K469DRAFT_727325 [Zopfia rhizophila CBS 207.26]
MPRLIRRNLTCHYCNQKSRNEHSGIPKSWLCPHCGSMNHLDERGDITDPPVGDSAPNIQYAQRIQRATSPVPAQTEVTFCKTCQRNQHLLNRSLAEYLPDEDDPEYPQFEASIDAYRAQLEKMYPQVCDSCIGGVHSKIRGASYAAKTDYLRHILDRTRREPTQYNAAKRDWTRRFITVCNALYLFSVLVGLLWHIFGIFTILDAGIWEQGYHASSWSECLYQTVKHRKIDQACFYSDPTIRFVRAALAADFFTIWWNPKLRERVYRRGGRLRHLKSQWAIRIFVLVARWVAYRFYAEPPKPQADSDIVNAFRAVHSGMLILIIISTILTYSTVYIDYTPTFSFMQSIEPQLPSPPGQQQPNIAPRNQIRRSALSSFDNMSQSFDDAFPINRIAEAAGATHNVGYPPSPSPTVTSSSSSDSRDDDSGITDRYFRSGQTPKYGYDEGDSMDWTPTKNTFAPPQEILPPIYGDKHAAPQPQPQQPHSIFAKPPMNPFRGKLPPHPKHPLHKAQNPFPQPAFQEASATAKKNFFSSMISSQGSREARDALQEAPKRVKKDAEFFQPPKLQYTGQSRLTGLEGAFESFFQGEDEGEMPVGSPTPKTKKVLKTMRVLDEHGRPHFEQVVVKEAVEQGGWGQMLLVGALPIAAGAVIAYFKGWY